MLTWQYDCTFFCLQICCSSISCFTHYENCATPIKQTQDDAAIYTDMPPTAKLQAICL